jgi:hypothetical protein
MATDDNGQPRKFNPRKYKIPGINPRYNLAVGLFAGIVGGTTAWWLTSSWAPIDAWFYRGSIAFVLGVIVMLGISTASKMIQRILRWLR